MLHIFTKMVIVKVSHQIRGDMMTCSIQNIHRAESAQSRTVCDDTKAKKNGMQKKLH